MTEDARLPRLPLHGRRVVVTRRREQAGTLCRLLRADGATVLRLPLIELAPPPDPGPLDAAIDHLEGYAWVVFTSPNAVRFFCARMPERGRRPGDLSRNRIAALGPATSGALARYGLQPDLVPVTASQEGLIAAFAGQALAGCPVLFPGSALARPALHAALTRQGACVTRVIAYINRVPDPDPQAVAAVTDAARPPDAIVFASPSAVQHLFACLGDVAAHRLLAAAAIACIGPTTATAVTERGHRVAIQPADSRISALVRAVCDHFAASAGVAPSRQENRHA